MGPSLPLTPGRGERQNCRAPGTAAGAKRGDDERSRSELVRFSPAAGDPIACRSAATTRKGAHSRHPRLCAFAPSRLCVRKGGRSDLVISSCLGVLVVLGGRAALRLCASAPLRSKGRVVGLGDDLRVFVPSWLRRGRAALCGSVPSVSLWFNGILESVDVNDSPWPCRGRAACSLPRSLPRMRTSDTETDTESATETVTAICHCHCHLPLSLNLNPGTETDTETGTCSIRCSQPMQFRISQTF